MTDYETSAKGIIDRNAVIQNESRFGWSKIAITMLLISACAVYFYHISKPISYIWLVFDLVLFIGIPIYKYTKSKSKEPVSYYLELDAVSSSDILAESKHDIVRTNKGFRSGDITYYSYLCVFKSGRRFELEYSSINPIKRNKYPKIKKSAGIPNHMEMLERLTDGNECYLLFADGNDKVIDIFDSRYYTPSPDDFRQDGDKYYLKN